MGESVDPNKPDYLDKGVDAGLKKYGGAKFQDSEKNRGKIEKVTDKARQMFEKFTGSVTTLPFCLQSQNTYNKRRELM